MFLREEGYPRTPQEISNWTGIGLMDVYDVLQNNKMFFREIIDDDSLKGWIIDDPML